MTASLNAPISIHDAAAPAPSDVDPAMLEQMMRKLASASAGEFNAAPGAAPESRLASEHRSAATAESRFAGKIPQPSTTSSSAATQVASTVPAAAGDASAIERAIAAANADARTSEPMGLAGEGREGFGGNPLRDAIRPQADGSAGSSTQTFTLASGASLAPTQASTATAATQNGSQILDLRTPMQQPEWAESLGEKVVVLSQSDTNSAQIRLNPAHLGPLEVRVSIERDQASVSFMAQHAVTREALEAATPRLREMLQAQGFGNVNVDISQHSGGQRSAHEQRQPSHERNTGWQPQMFEKRDAGYVQSRSAAREPSVLDTFA